MAKIIIGFNIVMVILSFFGIPLLTTVVTSVNGKPPEIWYHVSMVALVLPEILYLVSSNFRKHIAESFLINGEQTIKSKLTHYTTAVCLKLFGIVVVTELWYEVQVSYWWKVSLLISAFGIEGLGVLKAALKHKIEKLD